MGLVDHEALGSAEKVGTGWFAIRRQRQFRGPRRMGDIGGGTSEGAESMINDQLDAQNGRRCRAGNSVEVWFSWMPA